MIPAATTTTARRKFSSASYLRGLMAELDRAAISIRLGQSREHARITQREMADLLHVHFRTVQDWESPRKNVVPFDRLDEWAQLTQVSRQWLLYGEEPTQSPDAENRLLEAAAVLADAADRLARAAARLERTLDAPR